MSRLSGLSVSGLTVDLAVANPHDYIEPDGNFPIAVLSFIDFNGRLDEGLLTRLAAVAYPSNFALIEDVHLVEPWRGFGRKR